MRATKAATHQLKKIMKSIRFLYFVGNKLFGSKCKILVCSFSWWVISNCCGWNGIWGYVIKDLGQMQKSFWRAYKSIFIYYRTSAEPSNWEKIEVKLKVSQFFNSIWKGLLNIFSPKSLTISKCWSHIIFLVRKCSFIA